MKKFLSSYWKTKTFISLLVVLFYPQFVCYLSGGCVSLIVSLMWGTTYGISGAFIAIYIAQAFVYFLISYVFLSFAAYYFNRLRSKYAKFIFVVFVILLFFLVWHLGNVYASKPISF
jgi:hypothetical protein